MKALILNSSDLFNALTQINKKVSEGQPTLEAVKDVFGQEVAEETKETLDRIEKEIGTSPYEVKQTKTKF